MPDYTVIARFRRRHVERLEAVFVRVLEMCRDAGLLRPAILLATAFHLTCLAVMRQSVVPK